MMESETYSRAFGLERLLPFWVAFLGAALLAFPIYRALLAMKSRQTVSQFAPEGHQKKQGTPTMGGLIIVAGVLISLAVYFAASAPPLPQEAWWNRWFGAGMILLVGFALIGFVDDFVVPRLFKGKRGLGWKQKILMQVVLAVLATGTLLSFKVTGQAALYVFLILFASNAYNFLDGLDGLAGSVLIALCGGLLVLGQFAPFGDASRVVLHALVGATIPFLFLNAPPAKLFMGDVGSLPIGALLGLVLANLMWPFVGGRWIFYTPYSTLSDLGQPGIQWSMIVPCLIVGFVLIAELIPVPMQIFWVKVFKRKLFPYTPIHHAFEKAGWPESRVVWHFLLVQILCAALAYTVALRSVAPPDRKYHYYYQEPGAGAQP